MQVSKERLAQLALLWSEAVGSAGLARVVAYFGSAWKTVHARREELASPSVRLRPEQVALISTLPARLERFEEEWRQCEGRFIRVVFAGDDEYPAPLVGIPNAPAVLTMYGNWLPTDDPAVAIVGTRSPTSQGEDLARDLASACARRRLTVVSGLAQGLDQAAHRGALAAGGRTVAVVGCGLLAIPRDATGGLEATIARDGAVISELGPYSKMSVPHLMARNRITSGLARAVMVVQSRGRGGSLVTADYAQKQGRLVLAVPWPDGTPEGVGTAKLLDEGARRIEGPAEVADLADHLRGGLPAKKPDQLSLFENP